MPTLDWCTLVLSYFLELLRVQSPPQVVVFQLSGSGITEHLQEEHMSFIYQPSAQLLSQCSWSLFLIHPGCMWVIYKIRKNSLLPAARRLSFHSWLEIGCFFVCAGLDGRQWNVVGECGMGMNLDEKFQANAGGEYISVWLKGTGGPCQKNVLDRNCLFWVTFLITPMKSAQYKLIWPERPGAVCWMDEKSHPNYIIQHLKNVNELDLMLVPHPIHAWLVQLCMCLLLSSVYWIAQWEHVSGVWFLQLILHYPLPDSESHRDFNDTQEEKEPAICLSV